VPVPKQSFKINFAQGLDRKSDPFQVAPGRFLALSNTIFDEVGMLKKRNGFGFLPSLPDAATVLSTTFNGNLLAIGQKVRAYNPASKSWVTAAGNGADLQPVGLSVMPAIRSTINMAQCGAAIHSNGLACIVSMDTSGAPYYTVIDSATGQTLIPRSVFSSTTPCRAFTLGQYFLIVYGASSNNLKYISINTSTLAVSSPVTISTQYSQASTGNFDGVVANNALYLAWNGTDGGGALRMTYIDTTLTQHNTLVTATYSAPGLMSVCADTSGSTPVIWVTWSDLAAGSAGPTNYAMAVNAQLSSVKTPTALFSPTRHDATSAPIYNLATIAKNGTMYYFIEYSDFYTFDSTLTYRKIITSNITATGGTSGYTVNAPPSFLGLASKLFDVGGSVYGLCAYQSTYQPTYFLVNYTSGSIIGKLAYENGLGYLPKGLPNVTVSGSKATLPYLIKDTINAVNKTQGASASGVYSQAGVNLATFDLAPTSVSTAELGNNLHVSGGFLWAYDGAKPVEQNFHLFPEFPFNADGTYHGATSVTTGGSMAKQIYFYVATYEWQDNQGNIHRSSPSIPLKVDISASATNTNTVTLKVPVLSITAQTKVSNVSIVVYRWSTAQQTYYRCTSLSAPLYNTTGTDTVTLTDTQSDAQIIGSDIVYTNGGVIEDMATPAMSALTVFQSRLVGINAEDPYTLWYSKQVVEASPVEMSDLFTIYVAPQMIGKEASGPCKTLSVMDDKLIIGRKGSFSYITGFGPDNTGSNNDFSPPVFINSAVGCDNQSSIAMIPDGLMFQASAGKGIWLLGRDLSMNYIGAPVEAYNGYTVSTATVVPGTNQVRFGLQGTSLTLVYDYFMKQWASFNNPAQLSACVYNNLHTYIDTSGKVYQETIDTYLDGSSPVLLSFTTSWLSLAGLQGFERAYEMSLLGQWVSPHKLSVAIAYDYAPAPAQVAVISPDNYGPGWGGGALWGSDGTWGGSTLEQWRIFFDTQKIQTFQITVSEQYDPSLGVAPGAGFTLSGLNIVVGLKKGWAPRPAKYSAG
jgi:hypothetical protein